MSEVLTAARAGKAAAANQTLPRFCFINSSKVWGGEERFVLDLASGLQGLNFDVMICSRPKSEFSRRVTQEGLSVRPLYVNFDYDPRPLWRLPGFSGEEVFVAITPRDFKLLRLLAYFRPKAKFFWHLGVAYPKNNWEYRRLFRSEKIRLLVPSTYLKSKVLSLFPGLENRITVLTNGTDVPAVDTALARQRLAGSCRLSPEKLFLGVFSRLTAGKGHRLVFEALRLVKNAGMSFHLWVVGDGPEREALRKAAGVLGIGEHVSFVGYQREVMRWMAGVDVLCSPSENESFGYVLLEGMALGKTVLASSGGGPAEIIENGENGILVPSSKPEIWAQGILELAKNLQRREKIGERARLSVQQNFSLPKMVSGFLKVVNANPAVGCP